MDKETRHIRSFPTTAPDGSQVTIDEYRTFIKASTSEDQDAEIKGRGKLRLEDGRAVNYLEKGKYQVFDTKEILTSDDPDAP